MDGGGDDLSIDELVSNLSTYKQQRIQVKKLLADDPGNSEYAEMEKELEEAVKDFSFITTGGLRRRVITLTEELLATAKQTELSALLSKAGTGSPSYDGPSIGMHAFELDSTDLSDFHKFPIGMKVQAVWSDDGEWYDATIDAFTPNGYYVTYDGWGNKEEVDPENVRPIEVGAIDSLHKAEREAEATKLAIKRKIAQAAEVDFESRTIPAKLRIDPNDPDDVKATKKKKIHAFKSKVRQEQLEVAQNKRQNAWQQFQTTKGKSRKIGFFSGRKRESIFKSPEDPQGKVGVTGSGKGLTEFQKREKHLHLKGGGIGDVEE